MDVIQFQEKLRNICELGKQNGNMLTHENSLFLYLTHFLFWSLFEKAFP